MNSPEPSLAETWDPYRDQEKKSGQRMLNLLVEWWPRSGVAVAEPVRGMVDGGVVVEPDRS